MDQLETGIILDTHSRPFPEGGACGFMHKASHQMSLNPDSAYTYTRITPN